MHITRPGNISRFAPWTAKAVTPFVPKATPTLSAVAGSVMVTL